MSPLEQQLKDLQEKKEKADLFRKVMSDVQTLLGDTTQIAVASVLSEFQEFTNSRIAEIEGESIEVVEGSENLSLTQEEVAFVKTLFVRLNSQEEAPVRQPKGSPALTRPRRGVYDDEDYAQESEEPLHISRPRQNPNRPKPKRGNEDILAFAMRHRSLDGKHVTFTNPRGDTMGGIVCGTEMPNILVKTDTGHTIKIAPEELSVG